MTNHIWVGKIGENLAGKYLQKNGFKIIAANVKLSYYELDIVAQKNGYTFFIEVKTRGNYSFCLAEDSLSKNKLHKFKKAVLAYCLKNKINLNKIFGDFIAINLDLKNKNANLKHFKNIF